MLVPRVVCVSAMRGPADSGAEGRRSHQHHQHSRWHLAWQAQEQAEAVARWEALWAEEAEWAHWPAPQVARHGTRLHRAKIKRIINSEQTY